MTSTSHPLLVGVDLGTTNVKALIFEADGRIAAEASVLTPTHYPQPTWAYYDPNELWQATVSALRQATDQIENGQRIVSIAVSSFGETGIPLDAQGQPTYHAIAWFDQRSQPQMAWLKAHFGAETLYETMAQPILPIYGLGKLLWLKENQPDALAKAAHWLNGADYIAYKLCGVPATEYSLASRTFMLDLFQGDWATDLLAEIGMPAHILPPLTPSGTALGMIRADVAAETGLPLHTQVSLGGHDHICGAFALGMNAPGKTLNSIGTAEAIFLPTETILADPVVGQQGYSQGLLVVQDEAYPFLMGGLYTSGASIDWLRQVVAGPNYPLDQLDYPTLIAEARAAPPGSLGVTFLPYLRMANSPYVDDKARGAFIGLTTDVKRGTLFRAILEGVCYEHRLSLETLLCHQGNAAQPHIYVTGGGTRNALWMQIKASILNQSITLVDVAEAVTLGAAILGGLGAGVYPTPAAALKTVRYSQQRIDPILASVTLYEAHYQQVYRQFHPTVQALHHHIYDLNR